MMLREELQRRLLEERGIYVKECCDKCGRMLGAVRFTRKDEPDEWCSAECRGDEVERTIRRGGRPRKYKTGALRQRAYRNRLRVTKPPRSFAETKDLQPQKSPFSQYPP